MARRKSSDDLGLLVREICEKAINEYVDIVWNIANDIYDSCIKQYYATYIPTVYKRHGDIEGFNLYRANSFTLEDGVLEDFDGGNPEALLKYGTKSDIRAEVLAAVLSGQRGITVRRSPRAQYRWPMKWVASYPNQYSQYNYWRSSAHTIEEIIDDFEANIINDTSDLLDKIIDKQFK